MKTETQGRWGALEKTTARKKRGEQQEKTEIAGTPSTGNSICHPHFSNEQTEDWGRHTMF